VTGRLLAGVRALLIDMDGVIYYNSGVLPGANEFLSFLRTHDIAHAFVTNGTRNRPADHRRKLAQFGIDIQDAAVFTAAMATADYIRKEKLGASVYVIGGDGFRDELQQRANCTMDDRNPEFVVVGFTETFDYQQLETACRAIHRGARLVVGDPDVNDPHPSGPLPGAGAFAAAIEAVTGCSGVRIGKPEPWLYEKALLELKSEPAHAAIVGDRMDSDIAGGRAIGIATILVLTGISTRESVRRAREKPDLVVDNLTHLETIWKQAVERYIA
jgi:5'-nucleotidase